MGVSYTSKLAFNKLKETKMGKQENEVFQYLIRLECATNKQIARALNMDASTVAGRMNSLYKKGLIYVHHVGACPITGQTVKHGAVQEYIRQHLLEVNLANKPKPQLIASNQATLI